MIRQIRLGLAAVAIAAAGLFTAGAAQAASLTCAQAGAHATDMDIVVENHQATDGPCTITVALNAKRNITIIADGPIKTSTLTLQPASNTNGTGLYGEYGRIYISGTDTVETGNIKTTADTISSGGDIVVNAGGTLKAGTMTAVLGSYIVVEAQKNGGNVPLVVGTTGTNGVGRLTTSGNNLTGQNPQFNYTTMASALVYVVNGNSASTGGISLTAATSIAVANGGGSRAGAIILNAQNGLLTIPGGAITVAGTGNIGGGSIVLLGNEVKFSGTATLNANGAATATFNNQISLSAATITYGTLTLESDGNGVPVQTGVLDPIPSAVILKSQGQYVIQDTQTVNPTTKILDDLKIISKPSNAPLSTLALNGTGALTVHANGNLAQSVIRGTQVSVSGTNVSLTSTGADNHGVYISASAGDLTFANTGTVTLNGNAIARAPSSTTNGGYVYVKGNQVAFNAKTYVVSANGPTTGAGDGGIVDVEATSLTTSAAFLGAKLSANAASASSGKAQTALNVPAIDSNPAVKFPAVNIQAGNAASLKFGNGTTLASFNLSATGGKTGGDGGKIVVDAGDLTVQNVLAVNASALGTSGKGGDIQLLTHAGSTTFTYNATQALAVKAIGGTTSGEGGKILVQSAVSSDAAQPLNVNALMKVDGGASIQMSDFDGSISHDGITCQQYPLSTSTANQPRFWSCLNPVTPTLVPAAINAIPTGLQAKIKGLHTYVFPVYSNYNTFFKTVGVFVVPAGALGVTAPKVPLNVSAVWVSSGSPVDYTTYLRGNMMHEIGHLLDQNISPTPSAVAAFRTAEQATITAMTGTPNPQTPTCQDVYGVNSQRCPSADTPWKIFQDNYIRVQDQHKEMFADAFQNCSNPDDGNGGPNQLFDVSENHAQQSIYMKDIWTYFNLHFWTGGCARQE